MKPLKVRQYNLDGSFVKEWQSCRSIASKKIATVSTIKKCCIGEANDSQGFIWLYSKDIEQLPQRVRVAKYEEDKTLALTGEEWRDIYGYEGRYQVSNMGRVLSLEHKAQCGNHGGTSIVPKRMLVGVTDNKGYLRVQLLRNTKKIHRLVADAFIPNPNNYPQVNHINGNKQDNRAENLEWCTNSENQIHAWRNGLQKSSNKKGRKIKMTHTITGDVLIFDSIQQAATYFGNSISYPSLIQNYLIRGTEYHKTFKGYKIEALTPPKGKKYE